MGKSIPLPRENHLDYRGRQMGLRCISSVHNYIDDGQEDTHRRGESNKSFGIGSSDGSPKPIDSQVASPCVAGRREPVHNARNHGACDNLALSMIAQVLLWLCNCSFTAGDTRFAKPYNPCYSTLQTSWSIFRECTVDDLNVRRP
jgi:hypothetical protein